MHRLVCLLTFTALSVHMLFGCCSHHAHTFATTGGSDAIAVKSSCGCSHHASHNADDENQQQDGHHDHDSDHRQCDIGNCLIVRTDPLESPNFLIGQQYLATQCVSIYPATIGYLGRPAASLGIPIPIHLANQTFLL
jgi:hypothetical protein